MKNDSNRNISIRKRSIDILIMVDKQHPNIRGYCTRVDINPGAENSYNKQNFQTKINLMSSAPSPDFIVCKLFDILGITGIDLSSFQIVISKGNTFTWKELEPKILEIIRFNILYIERLTDTGKKNYSNAKVKHRIQNGEFSKWQRHNNLDGVLHCKIRQIGRDESSVEFKTEPSDCPNTSNQRNLDDDQCAN